MRCQICQQIIEGKTQAKLTNHIRDEHQLSLEDYIILTEWNSSPPKCACDLCEERPLFSRGKYLKYALGHDSFARREKLYIEKYGQPKCLQCGAKVEFHRGQPRQFCTHTCGGLYKGGFTQQDTQDKIKQIVIDNYGVSNVSQIPSVRKIISEHQTGDNNSFYGKRHNIDTLEKISKSSQLNWTEDRKKTFSIIMNKVRKRNWQDPVYRKTILEGNLSGKHSKLHQRVATYLGLKELGFESEKNIFRYRVDEVNFEKKIIIEINGDHIHANPNKYNPDDLIIVRKSQYLAKDKWIYDQKRKEALEALGFIVFIIWESDNLEERRDQLNEYL